MVYASEVRGLLRKGRLPAMGLMSQSEKEQVVDWLRSRYHGCPHCNSKAAEVGDVLGLPVMERTIPSGIGPGQQVALVLPVTCRDCRYTVLFAAKEFLDLD